MALAVVVASMTQAAPRNALGSALSWRLSRECREARRANGIGELASLAGMK
jgi:hypothetical protein